MLREGGHLMLREGGHLILGAGGHLILGAGGHVMLGAGGHEMLREGTSNSWLLISVCVRQCDLTSQVWCLDTRDISECVAMEDGE